MSVDFNAIELYRELVREKQGEKAANDQEAKKRESMKMYLKQNMKTDQIVEKGHRLGFIRFGSRVEIIIPKNNFEILVKKDDKVRANLSSIGIFK